MHLFCSEELIVVDFIFFLDLRWFLSVSCEMTLFVKVLMGVSLVAGLSDFGVEALHS